MTQRSKSGYLEFKIIAGTLKGKKIRSPDLGITRPPLTRLRKAIFDYLNPYLIEASYLDLFSGTGSYLFEAVSRGAGRAVGVEMEPALSDAINRQATEFGIASRLTCFTQNVFDILPSLYRQETRFDVVMIAPPQYKGIIGTTLEALREHLVVHGESLIICQHDTSETRSIQIDGFELVQRRKYGNTTYTIIRLPQTPA